VCRSMSSFIHKEGKATIEGHAFLRRPDNVPENAVGQVVRLIPVTPYSEARFAHFYNGKKYVPAWQIPKIEADPEYARFTRTTTSDSNGRFTFDNVAPGKYFCRDANHVAPKRQSLFGRRRAL
jgi:hypothetical protein